MKVVPTGDPNLTVFIVIMLVGFLAGTYGHVIKSKTLVIVGISLIFASTVLLPLLIFRGGR